MENSGYSDKAATYSEKCLKVAVMNRNDWPP